MSDHRQYFWLVSKDEGGKTFLIFGSDRSEDDARQRGLELLSGAYFEVKQLPTKDLSRASSLLKGNRLERTRSLKEASKRLGHEKSLKRMKQRQAKQSQPHW